MTLRAIRRISDRYGMQTEVQHVVDQLGVTSLKYLDLGQLERLLQRVRNWEDSIQTASDPPDAPPAR